MSRFLPPFVALTLLTLSACSTLQSIGLIQNKAQTTRDTQLDPAQADFRARVGDAHRSLGQHVDKPWIVGKPQALSRDLSLPPALQVNVRTTLLFAAGAADLVTLAERIYQACGIPVRVEPDALMAESAFLPRLSAEKTELLVTPPNQADTLVPPLAPLADSLLVAPRTLGPGARTASMPAAHVTPTVASLKTTMLPQGQAPLPMVLDAIALRLGVYWRYDAATAALVFFRTESRSFQIRALAQAADTTLELGLTGASSDTNGSFTSSNKTSYKSGSPATPLMAVVANIEHWLTRAGSIRAPEGGTNSIVVTDTPPVLDRIARFIDSENKRLTRRVRLVFEEVTLQQDDVGQAGVDWNLLFTNSRIAASVAGVGMLLDTAQAAGRVGLSSNAEHWHGSNITLHALAELGTILRHTQLPVLAINRRPATYAVRETFPYVKDLQQTQSTSDTSAPTVTVTQEKETVGTFLTVIPDAQDDGQVLLTLGYDTKRLVDLKKMEFGAGERASFVQQPYINGQGSTQQVIVQSGQRVLVAGFDQSDDNYKHRRLDKQTPMLFGGSDASQQKRVVTLLFVTAIAEDGA